MIGKISKAPGPGGTPGLLTADNGRSYTFTSAGWIASSVVPAVGMGVEFDLRGSHAVNVRPTGPFRRPLSGSGSAAGLVPRQDNPPPGSQLKPRRTANPKQQINRSRGSMLAAMRPMISIFMVTPLTIPLVLLLPIIGRLEIISDGPASGVPRRPSRRRVRKSPRCGDPRELGPWRGRVSHGFGGSPTDGGPSPCWRILRILASASSAASRWPAPLARY